MQVLWYQYEVATVCCVMTGLEKLFVHLAMLLTMALICHQLYKQSSALYSCFI